MSKTEKKLEPLYTLLQSIDNRLSTLEQGLQHFKDNEERFDAAWRRWRERRELRENNKNLVKSSQQ